MRVSIRLAASLSASALASSSVAKAPRRIVSTGPGGAAVFFAAAFGAAAGFAAAAFTGAGRASGLRIDPAR